VSERRSEALDSPTPSAALAEPEAKVRSPRAHRVAVTVVFFLLGAGSGTWAARIPAVKGHLGLSAGVLGLALLGPAVGALASMPATGALLATIAPRRIVQMAFVPFGMLLAALSVAGSAWELFVVLAGWGAAMGAIDVAMNTEATALQDRLGRRVMSRFHAAYSVGGLVGAGSGALAATTGVSVTVNFCIAGVAAVAIGVTASTAFSPSQAQPGTGMAAAKGKSDRPRRRPQLSWTLVALAAIAFGCFLAEGAANDWSAVYLHSSLGAGAGLAALAYTVFSCAMATGRLAGDHLAERVGPVRLVRLSGATATIGFVAALVARQVGAAMAGFVLLGLGLSFVVPLAFTAASQLGRPGPSLATVSACGYLGLLVGPALIGGIADAIGLPDALGVVVAVSAATAALAGAVAPRRRLGESPKQ
jgi:MFS family permease